jgi:MFS transporter, DHA1 family, multidrug resistance protein
VSQQSGQFTMGRVEFIALIAMMFATIAFSIDSMLPALPAIGLDLSPETPENAAFILTSFVLGMGAGTFISGPLSDAFGRRRIIFVGTFLYIASAAVAWASSTLEIMLIARLFQGLGASGPRIVAVAIVRDLYSGREMARIVSIVMLIFTLVPAFAPAMGAVIIAGVGWRGIFLAFIIFSTISVIWMGLRMPETLDPADRRPIRFSLMTNAVKEMFAHPAVRLSIFVQSLAMGILFLTLMLIQQIYANDFNRAESFPFWFGGIALVAGTSSLLNASLVMRFGMRRMVTLTLGGQIIISAMLLVTGFADLAEPYGFAGFLFWQTCVFFQAGLTLGNLNAIAMEPMGHIAGMAASVIGAFSTVIAALIASGIVLVFVGSIHVLFASVLLMSLIGFALMLRMGRIETQMQAAE